MPTSNKIYSFASAGIGITTVTVQSPHGLSNGDIVEIMHCVSYLGTYTVSNVQTANFQITAAFTSNEQGAAWQISRARPVLVNPEGETIDTLRQAVNQVSSDVGNKFELSLDLADRRDLVKAINSVLQSMNDTELKVLIRSIATN